MEPWIPFGAQYYRAPTPVRTDWRNDMRNMRDCGFNTVKLWAQWRWNAPREGEYDFGDLDELMRLAAEFGLHAIINVVFDVMPSWLALKAPDCVMITCGGRRVEPQTAGHRTAGGAPGPCYCHPEALRHRMGFLSSTVNHFKDHPALYVWDLWNEPELTCGILRRPDIQDLVCYCPHCRDRFITWLKERYITVEKLNARWNRNYQCWEELELPRNGHAFIDMIDWRLFHADVLTGELELRVGTVKAEDCRTPVMVHTVPMPYFNAVTCCNDDFKLARACDLFGNSIGSQPFAAAFNTSCAPGKTVINSEIHALGGTTYHRPAYPSFSDIKGHIFVPLARGIKGFVYWQYRPERLGLESPAWGLTSADGGPTPWLEYNSVICRALQRHADTLSRVKPIPSDIAVLMSYKGQIFDWCASGSVDTSTGSVIGLFDALHAANLNADFLPADELTADMLSCYRMVVAPFPYYMESGTARLLREWVGAGGLLVSEAFFATLNGDTGLHEIMTPGLGMQDVFGAVEGDVYAGTMYENSYVDNPLAGQTPPIPVDVSGMGGAFGPDDRLPGYLFREELVSRGAEAFGRFENGAPAITVNRYGKGRAALIGTLVGCAYHKKLPSSRIVPRLLKHFAESAGIAACAAADMPGLRVDLLIAPDGAAAMAVNGIGNESGEASITVTLDIGDKSEAVNIIDGSRYPVLRIGGRWELKLPVEKNHHEVYVLV